MSVYVDTMRAKFGRMVMCHMMADTSAELLDMAGKIGLKPEWIQHPGTPKEHFDVSLARRSDAIIHGARIATPREILDLLKRKAVSA